MHMLDGSKSIFKNIRRKVHCFECGEKIKMNTTKYMNTSLSVGERAQDLLSRMTLKEKIGQMNQKMHGWNAYKVEGETVELTEAFAEEVVAKVG